MNGCKISGFVLGLTALWPVAGMAAQQSDKLETKYGEDIKVINARRISGKGDLSGVHIQGGKTLVTVLYPRSHSVLSLHADDIVTKSAGADQFAHAELTGSVRYTMTQKLGKNGVRVVEGTADHAIFNHKAERIELTGAVHSIITDPERLAQPGTLHASHVVVEMSKSPYLYTLSGDPDASDIRFTPRDDAPAPNANAKQTRTTLGEVHIHGYAKGTFQIGQAAHFEGDGTVIELADKERKSQATLHASEFDADFSAAHSALKRAEAGGNVRYNISRPLPKGAARESLIGRSEQAAYDPAQAKFTLTDNVDAEIMAPGALQGPAKIRAEKLIAHTTPPYSYEIKTNPQNALISFTPAAPPVPAPKPGEKAAPPRFAVGTVKITKFDGGTYQPGHEAKLTAATGKVVFESDDAATRTRARILARNVTANLLPDNTIGSALATGEVEFRVEQTDAVTNFSQKIEGGAKELTYANAPDSRQVAMQGAFHASITDPAHLAIPGTITGETGDKLILSLTGNTYEYDIQSENETGIVNIQPLEHPKEPAPKPPAGRKPKPTDKPAKPEKKP